MFDFWQEIAAGEGYAGIQVLGIKDRRCLYTNPSILPIPHSDLGAILEKVWRH